LLRSNAEKEDPAVGKLKSQILFPISKRTDFGPIGKAGNSFEDCEVLDLYSLAREPDDETGGIADRTVFWGANVLSPVSTELESDFSLCKSKIKEKQVGRNGSRTFSVVAGG
jgi:hypothetical protein